tara:strand:- start:53 stop:1009 length:957 start_codon:yes stop_codon:yes gene_type:complete
MANDKFYGYSPKRTKPSDKQGQAYSGLEKGGTYENIGNRLDRVNPYEFRKGMDYELVQMGCSRLAESTPEEREKATESVLKNLEEHQAYYSALIQFERGMDQASPINETSFKKYLEAYNGSEGRGDGMVEVDKEIKNDKMEEPKYDKSLYTLKEAIKKEINNILTEAKDDDKDEKKASKGAKKSTKSMKALDKEEEKLRDQKKKLQDKIFPLIQDFKNKKIDKDKYEKKVGDIPQQIKDINKRLGEIDKEKEAIILKEKEDRRAVAETAMDREVHMELLNIIKEAGVSLKEGSDGVKTYYEIAKIAYMEGLTAGLRGE